MIIHHFISNNTIKTYHKLHKIIHKVMKSQHYTVNIIFVGLMMRHIHFKPLLNEENFIEIRYSVSGMN